MTAPMIAKLALLAATSHALAPNAVTSVIREKLAEVEEPAALDLAAKYAAVDLPSSRTPFVRTNAKRAAPAMKTASPSPSRSKMISKASAASTKLAAGAAPRPPTFRRCRARSARRRWHYVS